MYEFLDTLFDPNEMNYDVEIRQTKQFEENNITV